MKKIFSLSLCLLLMLATFSFAKQINFRVYGLDGTPSDEGYYVKILAEEFMYDTDSNNFNHIQTVNLYSWIFNNGTIPIRIGEGTVDVPQGRYVRGNGQEYLILLFREDSNATIKNYCLGAFKLGRDNPAQFSCESSNAYLLNPNVPIFETVEDETNLGVGTRVIKISGQASDLLVSILFQYESHLQQIFIRTTFTDDGVVFKKIDLLEDSDTVQGPIMEGLPYTGMLKTLPSQILIGDDGIQVILPEGLIEMVKFNPQEDTLLSTKIAVDLSPLRQIGEEISNILKEIEGIDEIYVEYRVSLQYIPILGYTGIYSIYFISSIQSPKDLSQISALLYTMNYDPTVDEFALKERLATAQPFLSYIYPIGENSYLLWGPWLEPAETETYIYHPDARIMELNNGSVENITNSASYTARFLGEIEIESTDVKFLTVRSTGTGGQIISIPEGIDCTSSCSAEFEPDTTVTLQAIPDPGYVFLGWTGDCDDCGLNTECTISLSTDHICSAEFRLLGDLNEDNALNIVDALLAARCALGLMSCNNIAADVNCDQQITIVDALLIARKSLNLSVSSWCK